jgi:hypothetical protein
MVHEIVVKLAMSLGTAACRRLARTTTPYFRALRNVLYPFENGCLVSLHEHQYRIREQRGVGFKREYKLVDIKGMNPFTLPLLVGNPDFAKDRPTIWYRGTNLKKIGHPKLSIRLNLTQRMYGLG